MIDRWFGVGELSRLPQTPSMMTGRDVTVAHLETSEFQRKKKNVLPDPGLPLK